MSRRQTIPISITTVCVFLLTACGGGGSGGPTSFNDSNGDGASADVGCSQEYFQTMLGSYTGIAELNRGTDTPEMCQWDITLELRGTSAVNACRLQAVTLGEVTQSTFYPDDFFTRYQCLDDSAVRAVHEPIADAFPFDVNPELDNSRFPVEIDVFAVSDQTRGPYFGDESVVTEYVQLFDGSVGEIVKAVIVEGDGTISLRDGGGGLLGTLIKGN